MSLQSFCRNTICWFLQRNHFHGILWQVSSFYWKRHLVAYIDSISDIVNHDVIGILLLFFQSFKYNRICVTTFYGYLIITFNAIQCQSIDVLLNFIMQSSCKLFSWSLLKCNHYSICVCSMKAVDRYWIYNALHPLLSIFFELICENMNPLTSNKCCAESRLKSTTSKWKKKKKEFHEKVKVEDNSCEICGQYSKLWSVYCKHWSYCLLFFAAHWIAFRRRKKRLSYSFNFTNQKLIWCLHRHIYICFVFVAISQIKICREK